MHCLFGDRGIDDGVASVCSIGDGGREAVCTAFESEYGSDVGDFCSGIGGGARQQEVS
jgi:hypothetical protein